MNSLSAVSLTTSKSHSERSIESVDITVHTRRGSLTRVLSKQNLRRMLVRFVPRVIVKYNLVVLNCLPVFVVVCQFARIVKVLVFRPVRRRWDFGVVDEREDNVNPVGIRLRLEIVELSFPVFRTDILDCPCRVDNINARSEGQFVRICPNRFNIDGSTLGELFCLFQTVPRHIDSIHFPPVLGEENGVSPFASSDIDSCWFVRYAGRDLDRSFGHLVRFRSPVILFPSIDLFSLFRVHRSMLLS